MRPFLLISLGQWLDVYDILETRLEHVQRGSAIPDGEQSYRNLQFSTI